NGALNCSGGHFTAPAFQDTKNRSNERYYAFRAEDLEVGANIEFTADDQDAFHAEGVVNLINAKVGADFDCRKARFELPGEEALWADGIEVKGITHLVSAKTDGILRFFQAKLIQGFDVSDVILDPTKACKWVYAAESDEEYREYLNY